MAEIVVVGGGLSGLVAAKHLGRAGHTVTLFEQAETVGGRVRSAKEDGYTFDRGFQVLFTAYPAVKEELDLDTLSLQRFRPGATLVQSGERSILADPLRDPKALTATLFNRNVSMRDKLLVLKLRRQLSRKPLADILEHDNQTIETYLKDVGFSERFVSNFATPFYGGITLDRSLSTSAFVFEYTFKMLLSGSIAVPTEGMGAIPAQLATQARNGGVTIKAGSPVSAITACDTPRVEISGETHTPDAVIVATDPGNAEQLLPEFTYDGSYRGCVTQYFSLPDTQQLRTGGRLLLNMESGYPNQVAPMSAVAPSYAPSRMQLLSATFLGNPTETADELAAAVRSALESWYPENNFDELSLLRTDRIPVAQVTQQPGFRDQRPAIDSPDGPVYLAGDYTEWSSIQGALESGRRAAMNVETAVQ